MARNRIIRMSREIKHKVLHEIGWGEDSNPVIGGGVFRAEFHRDPHGVFEFVLSKADPKIE
jgi:hypothetical protein